MHSDKLIMNYLQISETDILTNCQIFVAEIIPRINRLSSAIITIMQMMHLWKVCFDVYYYVVVVIVVVHRNVQIIDNL